VEPVQEERPLLADAQEVTDDHPADEDEDSYLTELRKAMTDDQPLGPRDEEDEAYGAGPPTGRSRFGRRR
jgi:hypothetical protein